MKKMSDTAGYQTGCAFYDPCPICYGCRNYHVYYTTKCDNRCGHNMQTAKANVCFKKEIHHERNFEKMLTRPVIDMDA